MIAASERMLLGHFAHHNTAARTGLIFLLYVVIMCSCRIEMFLLSSNNSN
jgi:hypothetical protein